jgi:hypothetical protein
MTNPIPLALLAWLAAPPLAAAQEPAADDASLVPDPPAAASSPEPPPPMSQSPDEQTGYYFTFAFVATLGEVTGAAMLGAGITALVDGYGRGSLADRAATAESADSIHGSADELSTTGWIGFGAGTLLTGAGLALDVFLGSEFGDDDWWLRACVTTPLAAAGTAAIVGGIFELERASFYHATSLDLSTGAAREAAQDDAVTFAAAGWSLIGIGSAAILAGGVVWLWDVFEADDRETADEEPESTTTVVVVPLASPDVYGLHLALTF